MQTEKIVQQIVNAMAIATEEDGQRAMQYLRSLKGYAAAQRIWKKCKTEHPELPRAQLLQLVDKIVQEERDCLSTCTISE